MTAPMIGRHVRALEDQLGTQLIHPTTRRHSLTEAGQIYYQRSKAILEELTSADESVAQVRSVPRGVLRSGAPVIFGSSYIAPALPKYLAEYPEVRVEMTLNNRVLDLLEEGYDLVIRTRALPDSGLIARALAPYRLVACAAPEYLTRHGAPKHPAELTDHSCLGFRPGSASEVWRFLDKESDMNVLSVSVSGPLVFNDAHSLREAALGGTGIVLQAEALLKDDLAAGRLVRVLGGCTPEPLPTHILFSPTRSITPKLRSFIDFAASRFGFVGK